MEKPTPEQKELYIQRLIFLANKLGYGVDLDADIEGAGMCVTGEDTRMILVRSGKKPNGIIMTLIHEITHAWNRVNDYFYIGMFGNILEEWECESIGHFVTQMIGIDRREKTEQFLNNYIGEPTFNTNDKVRDLVVQIYQTITTD